MDDLRQLLSLESNMKRESAKNAPTRHGRFGTMIWVKRDDNKLSTVSGQDVLKDERTAFLKMDKTKKWNKPKPQREAFDLESNSVNLRVNLTPAAAKHLRTFVEEFLDTSFNPFFTHLRKAIEREADRLTEATSRQFFFVISWFLEAERVRRTCQAETRQKSGDSRVVEPESFALVASVLNQETFVALNRYMQTCLDYKDWPELSVAMRCFTQILLTVHEMSQSPLDEDQEIAENIQSRIFYEETTHDRVLSILRGYKDQGFWYLDACTELAHVFLRMLEQYSKQNVDMQVRSKRRSRVKRREQNADAQDPVIENDEYGSEAEDIAEANKNIRERSFDFKRFSAKFCTQNSVNTFVAFTRYYRELDVKQLKRAHRFFYRVAYKQDLGVLLFRVDILSLFYKMIKGPEGVDTAKASYGEWEELTRQLFKKLTRKIQERPALITELLFSKIPATLYYLEFGHDKQTISSESRPAAELEVKPSAAVTFSDRIRIVVSALLLDGKDALVGWVAQTLASAANKRQSSEAQATPGASPSEPASSPATIPSIGM
jgi:replication fork protection complex subunit Tof1/Swi1